MRRCLIWLVFLLIFHNNASFAETGTQIEEVLNELRESNVDSTKISLFLQLADFIIEKDPSKAADYANMALALSTKSKEDHYRFMAIEQLLDISFNYDNDLGKSMDFLSLARSVDTNTITRSEKASLYGYEGNINLALGDFQKAQMAFFNQLKLFEQTKNYEGLAQVNFNIGELFYQQNQFSSAVSFYKKALERFRYTLNIYSEIEALIALGRCYGKMDDHTRNLYFAKQALQLAIELQNQQLAAEANLEIANAYSNLNKKDQATVFFEDAYRLGSQLGDVSITSRAATQLGNISAYECADKNAALEYFASALNASLKSDDLSLHKNVYQNLSAFYSKYKDYASANVFLTKLIQINDQISEREKEKQLIHSQIQYETVKKEQENVVLKATEIENKSTIQKQRILNLAALICILLLTGLVFMGYQSLQRKNKYNEHLEKEVKKRTVQIQERNDDLKKVNEMLEQSNNELERFAYIASHDLKTPLRNIISFLSLIERRLKGNADASIKEYFTFAKSNAKQMHYLIQDVLEFSKIESGTDIIKEKVDLNESLLLVTQNLQESMVRKNSEIFSNHLPVVEGNSVHLMQLLQNLIGNGFKYNESTQPKVEINYDQKDQKHFFSIKDNGIGIEPEYHSQIFEMFKRLHNNGEYQGTGIGLSICKKIVDRMKGDIWVESQLGEGTTFHFTFPVEN